MASPIDTPMAISNGRSDGQTAEAAEKSNGHQVQSKTRKPKRKYNHLFAIHSKSKASCLSSQDATETPSYVGFRNLMVLMLVVSNLRLMIENIRKVCASVSSKSKANLDTVRSFDMHSLP